ncbi:TetR/AcrR family transcriptional regulator [Muricauda sp. MAR_2010_75]|jgi:TetR/AcrR family transcriptional repressor of nem operon|uniref:TetR/AcrR family transcriptional regulator n=1 Tax=Allomuricauda sp. MAR_2010_75 TaxID=1250232 RepID=UPI0005615C05|nr:TetR/AcrR family transcriptional regulator [Muricauda sp. MAR_2010_75]
MEHKTLKGEIKRDTLIEKGMEILWSKGYNATSVNDIAKAADVPKGSFYFYFESKEDFTVKAIETYFETCMEPLKELLSDTSKSPKERLLGFHQHRASKLKNELDCKMGCLACNIGSEMAEHSEKIRKAIVVKEQWLQELLVKVVEEGQAQGEIDDSLNAADMVAFFEDAGKGVMTTMKELQSSYPIDNYLNMVQKIMFK